MGDRVEIHPDKMNANVRPGLYVITRVLPLAGQGLQYRAKNAFDSYERVIDESRLHTVDGYDGLQQQSRE